MAEQSIQLTKLASCAGCGAKVGAGVLAQLLGGLKVHSDPRLLVGFDKSDDASVYQVTDELALVQTVDFFPPIADGPYLFGQIAATNALSDVYAMGGEPKLALNLLCIPESMPKEAVHQLLRGGYDKAYEAGVIITGGHSILDPEPKYGLRASEKAADQLRCPPRRRAAADEAPRHRRAHNGRKGRAGLAGGHGAGAPPDDDAEQGRARLHGALCRARLHGCDGLRPVGPRL